MVVLRCRIGQAPVVVTAEELALHGADKEPKTLWLAILGEVFDVTAGTQHYGPGAAYSGFTGRDGSAAFITGNFTPAGLTSDVSTLSARELLDLSGWRDFYTNHETYTRVGVLAGRFYDVHGRKTDAYRAAMAKKKAGEDAAAVEAADRENFPMCNSRWTQSSGGEMWCSQDSGGIKRDWVGVPRKFFAATAKTERCACVSEEHLSDPRMKLYDNCAPDAVRCHIPKA